LLSLDLNTLIEYADWDRAKWHEFFRQHGDQALQLSAGPHGDGRMETAADVVRHIFSAEKRYVERLTQRPLTDAASIPKDTVEALFGFGVRSRKELVDFIAGYPADQWDVPQTHAILGNSLTATPRKIMVHVVTHEIRHWAQLGTLFRLAGYKIDFRDFLFSPVLGGEFKAKGA
jgi:uncharacterized damage-inducible protein DinB